jgi:hypothetical protein
METQATLGAILAIVGTGLYIVGSVVKNGDGYAAVQFSAKGRYILAAIPVYWVPGALLIGAGVVALAPRKWLGVAAGTGLGASVPTLTLEIGLLLWEFPGVPPWLILGGGAVGTAGSVLLLVAASNAKRTKTAPTETQPSMAAASL